MPLPLGVSACFLAVRFSGTFRAITAQRRGHVLDSALCKEGIMPARPIVTDADVTFDEGGSGRSVLRG